ncbi:MAG: ABC transporter permease, partial [Spirochaetaceae bacterium]|nr:ABC transporter permease [Spirochaetaceae bacterium]
MMMSITMAFRNLFRHKLKSILTILAITISVSLYIFMDAWILGMNLESRRNIVNFEMGAAKLQSKAYFEDKDDLPMYEKFNEWESYARALDEAGFESAPRFVFPGAIFSKNMSTGMQFIGCDPARDTALLRYADYIEMGRFISDNNFEIVMGANTAEKLQTGIPQRPKPADLDELITSLSIENEAAFIKSFYESAGAEQLKLKPNIARADYDRYWNILSEAGRMDLMISTVIDTKNESDERDRDGKIKINHSY